MAIKQELKPCPFCGQAAGMGSGPDGYFINCIGCLASTNILTLPGNTEQDVIDLWNTRFKLPFENIGIAMEDIKDRDSVIMDHFGRVYKNICKENER